jgi:hypothetical protein
MVSSETIKLYEQRIERCFGVAEKCTEGTWAHQFWTRTAITMLRQLNLMLGEDRIRGT